MSFDNVQFTTRPGLELTVSEYQETKTLLSAIDDLLEIQCSPGTWNANPYMHGLANGMHLIRSIISGEDPAFLSTPARWLDDEYNRNMGGNRGVFGSALISCVKDAQKKLTQYLKEKHPHEDYYLISEDLPLDELIPTVMLRYGPKNSFGPKGKEKRKAAVEEDVISLYWDQEADSWVAQLENDVPHPIKGDRYDNEEVLKSMARATLLIKRPERVTENTPVIVTGRPPVVGRVRKMKRRRRTTTVGRLHRESEKVNTAFARKRTAALKPADKRVVNDFTEGVPNDGGRAGTLWTDGKTLEAMGLGRAVIAINEDGTIHAIDGYSSRREQSIVRYLKKVVPARFFFQDLPYGWPVVEDPRFTRTSSTRRRRKATQYYAPKSYRKARLDAAFELRRVMNRFVEAAKKSGAISDPGQDIIFEWGKPINTMLETVDAYATFDETDPESANR